MNKKFKELWVQALRSGNYKQFQGALMGQIGQFNNKRPYCCLGVLARIQGAKIVGRHFVLGGKAIIDDELLDNRSAAGLRKSSRRFLARLNDEGYSFKQIADQIEKRY